MNKNVQVGIDLGSKYIRILITSFVEGTNHPVLITGAVEPSEGIRHGRITSHKDALRAISRVINKTEKEFGKKINNINVAISGEFTKTKIVKTKNTVSKASNEISELDFEKAKTEAIGTIPGDSPYHILNVTLSEVKVDNKKIKGNALHSVGSILETTQIIHLIPKKILEEYVHIFDELNINISEIVLGQLVSYIPVTKRSERALGVGVLNIGHDTSTFVYFENELPIVIKTWALGGSNITNDIALMLETKIDDAEEIKKNYKDLNVKKVPQIISARLEDLSDLIKKEISSVNKFGKLPGGIILIGGGAKIEEIENILKKNLGMQVSNGNKIMASITKNNLKDTSWATAYGLTYLETIEEKTLTKILNKIKKLFNQILSKLSP